MELLEHTLYINLEDRKDRRAYVEAELRKLKLHNAQRFNAVKLTDGALGCTMSHLKCVQMAKAAGWPYVFICEDDITFVVPKLVPVKLKRFVEAVKDWDVLILCGNNFPPYTVVNSHCIKVENCQTTAGYIVRAHYYDTLIQNFKESAAALVANLADRRKYAIDIYWKRLQGKGAWYMLTPAMATQRDDWSDIENRHVQYSSMMLDIEKTSVIEEGKEFVMLETGETLIVDKAVAASASTATAAAAVEK